MPWPVPSRSCAQTPLDKRDCMHCHARLMLLACGPRLRLTTVAEYCMQLPCALCRAVHSRIRYQVPAGSPLGHQAALPPCMPCQHAHACAWEQSHTCCRSRSLRGAFLKGECHGQCPCIPVHRHHWISALACTCHARLMLLACSLVKLGAAADHHVQISRANMSNTLSRAFKDQIPCV